VFFVALAVAAGAGLLICLTAQDVRGIAFSEGWENHTRGGAFLFVVVLFVIVLWGKGLKAAVIVFVSGLVLFVLVGAIWLSATSRYDVGGSLKLAASASAIVAVVVFLVGLIARMLGGAIGVTALASVAVVGGLVAGRAGGAIGAVLVSLAMAALAKQALRDDARDRPVERLAHRLVRRWGTRFVGADLRGANLRGTHAAPG